MEIIFKNRFVEYAIDTQLAMSRVTHFLSTEDMEEEEFKEIVLKIFDYSTEYQIDKSLLDFRELRFSVSPDIQAWMAKKLKSGYRRLKKTATIIPIDFIPNLSVQQTMDEIDEKSQEGEHTENRYFDNEQDALRWLLED